MKTRIFTLIMSLFVATMAFAYDAEIDGIYYNLDETNKTVEVTNGGWYGSYARDIIIPEKVTYNGVEYSVTSIGDDAFRECSLLTSITIPNSVTSIEGSAFAFCSSLTSVQWNAKKCSDFDVDYSSPFYYCEQITSFTFGDNVEHIPAYLCYGMSKLTSITIPNSVTSIGDEAFRGCSSLTSISIPNSVTSIEYEAFRDCSFLTSVYISDIAAWCNIEFGNYYSNPLVYAENLYLNNTKVTDLVIPEGVDSIKDYVFFDCSFLTSITIPNSVTSIGNHAFEYCSSLTSITLPNSVTSIGSCAFEGCSSLISVTIPNSVTSIGAGAFKVCSSLASITIPNSVTEFGDDILYECNNIQILNAPAQIFNQVTEEYQTQFSNKLTEVHITDGELDENGFNYINRSKKSLHTIDLAGTTNTAINDLAFYDCYKLENLMLPGNLETIGFKAVAECYQLKEINIPASVVEINDAAFENCRSIKSITFGGQAEAKSFASRMKRAAASGDVALQRIGNWAFYNCHALENLVIPEGVTEVGDAAFYGCTYLDSLALPSTTQRIGDNCFALCSRMKQINVNATVPPTIFAKTFFDVNRNIPVIVPEGAREAYANDEYWGEFINVVESDDEDTQIENAENANVAIYSVGGVLYVDGLSADYQVFDVNGRLVYTGRDAQLTLPRGVYMIAIEGEVEKVVI